MSFLNQFTIHRIEWDAFEITMTDMIREIRKVAMNHAFPHETEHELGPVFICKCFICSEYNRIRKIINPYIFGSDIYKHKTKQQTRKRKNESQ